MRDLSAQRDYYAQKAETDRVMITIEITNLDELVKEHRGAVSAMLGKLVKDVEGEVEAIIVEELKTEFEKRGIKANICSIEGIRMRRFVNS